MIRRVADEHGGAMEFKRFVLTDEKRERHPEPKPCEVCSALVITPGRRFKYVYCSHECRWEVERRRHNERARKRRALPRRACARCGEPFQPTRSDNRYCTGRCRTAAYRERVR